jgi:5-methylcytosine-specific restriction endonuclease McrA
MKDLREGLQTAFEDAEQLNRRLRQLRKDGWIIYSYKDDGTLAPQEYRLANKGLRIWSGERKRRNAVSSKTRRIVLDRDGNRCVVCGVGARECYPDEPEVVARMTMGHRIPGERLGEASIDNLRTECSRCNEPVRDLMPDPERFDEVISAVRVLNKGDKLVLREWIVAGQRSRLPVDVVYDRIRQLSPAERRRIIGRLDTFLGAKGAVRSS